MHKRILLLTAIVLLFSPLFAQDKPNDKPLVIFLVRHAEKVDNSRDPELSKAGKQRALELAETLINSKLDYIYSTDFIRTKNTAQPTAEMLNIKVELYNPLELKEFASKLKETGGRHLIVGHSNTTPEMVKLLGGEPGTPIVEENEYDRLYVITTGKDGKINTVLLRYGEKHEVTEHP